MSQPTKSEYFNYTFSPGRIGNSKIVITAEPKAAECIARIATDEGKWRKHQDTFIAVMEQRPSKKWITETSHAVYEEYMKTGDEQILNDWTDCVKGGIAQLFARVHFAVLGDIDGMHRVFFGIDEVCRHRAGDDGNFVFAGDPAEDDCHIFAHKKKHLRKIFSLRCFGLYFSVRIWFNIY